MCCFLFFAPYGLKKVRFTCYRALSAPAQSPIEGSHHRHRPATGSMMSRGNINASTAPAHKTTACKVVSKTRKIGKKRRKSHFFVYFAKKQTLNSKSRSVGAKAVQLQLVESLIVLVVTLARFHRHRKHGARSFFDDICSLAVSPPTQNPAQSKSDSHTSAASTSKSKSYRSPFRALADDAKSTVDIHSNLAITLTKYRLNSVACTTQLLTESESSGCT